MSKKPDIALVADMTATDARALIAAEEQAVVKACGADIQAVLAKHGCLMGAVPKVVPTGAGGPFTLGANVVIQVKPKE